MQEFHIHKSIRDKYQLDQSLYELDGNVIFANVQAVRKFVQTINQSLDPATAAEKNITTSQINALGLIDEILHYVFAQYRNRIAPTSLQDAYQSLIDRLGEETIFNTLLAFCQEFPPIDVYQKAISLDDYLASKENQKTTLEEMILLHLANRNPAFMQYGDFFDDTFLTVNTAYIPMMKLLEEYFAMLPGFGPDSQDIISMLHSPAVISPYSLEGQLQYIRTRWAELVQGFLLRILGGEDLIKEETKAIFAGPGPAHIPDYGALRKWIDLETERFSPDSDWMPRLVLIAKNSYVWLYQLSKKYQRSITHLDQIPDEELDTLAASGITGLWLIGLWERSKASENIKKMCGNPEAVASAYSIMDYRIADDLGGHAALQNLKTRAWQRGIRLASDMVPNHMGIDSGWVIDHPEYFVSVPYSPYPAYRFDGPNLSPANHVGIYLEDHYFDRSDAAVVFKRVDHGSGSVQYIYHGNDGTTMPWNDTAQLNYLSAQVREEVIQLILRVARDFPVIRFDAAMTLAKKHYQRLWFPEPGHGGAIPSRSEHAISPEEFHRVFPEEFWREVVDRVAREVPDTLLLAEAFWLMESYFVRTLGMHRVYNSAFMNMLRNEENAKYRALMKNTLEFDPEILKRFVNFMNNPDERTAVDQFGKGDKYFGICTLMVTLPGLPMFGHGQIEGYSEKYGMEYRRAYLDELPDQDLINRHQWQVFPIAHQRYLFSGVEHFYLYDFFRENGSVDEDVYAYSNGAGNHRALVIFHNKYASTQGWIKTSASRLNKGTNKLQHVSIGEGLGLHRSDRHFVILHDQVSAQEILYRSDVLFEKGCFFHLDAYTCLAFNSIQEVEDFDGSWAALYGEIGGILTRDIFHQYKMRRFRELHHTARDFFRSLFLMNSRISEEPVSNKDDDEIDIFANKSVAFYRSLRGYAHLEDDRTVEACHNFKKIANQILEQRQGQAIAGFYASNEYRDWLLDRETKEYPETFPFLEWILAALTASSSLTPETTMTCVKTWFDEFSLAEPVIDCLREMHLKQPEIDILLSILSSELALQPLPNRVNQDVELYLQRLFTTEESARMLGVNTSGGVTWFRKESLENWIAWKRYSSALEAAASEKLTWSEKLEWWLKIIPMMDTIQKAIEKSRYQVDQLISDCKTTSEKEDTN